MTFRTSEEQSGEVLQSFYSRYIEQILIRIIADNALIIFNGITGSTWARASVT